MPTWLANKAEKHPLLHTRICSNPVTLNLSADNWRYTEYSTVQKF